jgi:hypothetical protein
MSFETKEQLRAKIATRLFGVNDTIWLCSRDAWRLGMSISDLLVTTED